MDTITESELTDFVRSKAVRRLRIVQCGIKKYTVVANITWKEGDWTVATTRGRTKEWASLDRLVRHILSKCDTTVPHIELTMETQFKKTKENDHDSDSLKT